MTTRKMATMRKMLAAAILIASSTSVFAQGTAAQRAACTPDVWRLCSSEIPNVGAIIGCLQKQRPNLSAACRQVMDTAGQTATRSLGANQTQLCGYDTDNPLDDDWRKWCGKGAWKQ